ncbi:hypothetical protein C9F11_37450 [Streptomyces sp. YIM 121038]|uniref:hypothetical protein n=1 Tax=Streptomyces sp. YIM 121038 TaxID=2136401 RepID=UPI0011105CB7|nr:hypothetical protein [Streptomyces sp. YIM 121038]QCX81073.1 hypothetical protein C9F11_37450 [Streptomyces sp. YIM 121038]
MNHTARRTAMTIVSLAALITTGWSLYTVARHYDTPKGIAGAAVAVFDGIAYMCLHLASEAATDGRSAFGARLTALAMAGMSVYLNITHANLIGGGLPAAVLFAVPTLGLLAVSEMSWSGPRAQARAARGDRPYRLPAFGGWAWVLAPGRASKAVMARAVDHIQLAGQPSGHDPDTSPSATDLLRVHFAQCDPAEAIRIAHESQPDLAPADLAALLRTYGVNVDAVQVALVLHGRPAQVTVERPDSARTTADTDRREDPRIALARADMLSGQRPDNITTAVRALLDRGVTDRSAVVTITRELLGPDTNPDSVRRTFERELKLKKQPPDDGVGQGGGGYA